MKKKMNFADLFQLDETRNVKINKEEIKVLKGGAMIRDAEKIEKEKWISEPVLPAFASSDHTPIYP